MKWSVWRGKKPSHQRFAFASEADMSWVKSEDFVVRLAVPNVDGQGCYVSDEKLAAVE